MSRQITIIVDGQSLPAEAGRPLSAILLGAGISTLRKTARRGAPRGVFCGMGVCFDCLLTVNGREDVRACVTPVSDGMRVETVRT